MVSIGVYARMMKHAGNYPNCPNYVYIFGVLFQSKWFYESINLVF